MSDLLVTVDLDQQQDTERNIEQAKAVYNIAYWSGGYFDIHPSGKVIAYPKGQRHQGSVFLIDLIDQLRALDLTPPVLVRFMDIIQHRLDCLQQAFIEAILHHRYHGHYTSVYPIKVNQQRYVVEQVANYSNHAVGLEAGSKSEIIAVLGASSHRNLTIVCNGYKDQEYIRLALIGQKLGHSVYIIMEKLSELPLLLQEAQRMQITPQLGIRIRLTATCSGKWQDTGGEKAKFGFSVAQVIELLDKLKAENKSHWLKVMHFHLGSQIANIADIQKCLSEGARYYAELHKLGFNIETVDLGGGLAIDYDGTRTRSNYSMNYTLQEYANNIVQAFTEVCQAENLPHPNIITESGRAITAHHAVLLTDVIDIDSVPNVEDIPAPHKDDPQILQNLWQQLASISEKSALEVYHEACYWVDEAYGRYVHGILDLNSWARIEQIYFSICFKVKSLLKPSMRSHRPILDELNEKLADKYFVNFSLFQSLPDAWAIDQPFPILPLTKLNQPLSKRATLQDLTCDSDGRVDKYVDNDGLETTLPLPTFHPEQPYYLSMFLLGAYQEILGDMHNLFGDTHSVNVFLNPDGSYRLCNIQKGDDVETMLRYVNFDIEKILQTYRHKIAEQADITAEEKKCYEEEILQAVQGYTYFEG